MANNLVVRNNGNALSKPSGQGQSIGARPDRPLGTADWLTFPAGQPYYPVGGFGIGELPTGAEIGIRDDRAVLVTSGARGGKDATVIIPNLIRWPGSVVVIDPKGENAMVTARRRGRGSKYSKAWNQKTYLLDPFDAAQRPDDNFSDIKACFNPLEMLSANNDMSVEIAGVIAESVVISEGGEQNYWNEAAQQMLKMEMLDTATSPFVAEKDRNLGTVRKSLVAGDTEMRRLMMLNASDEEKSAVPSSMALLFARMKRNPAFGGIIAEAGERYANLLETSPRTLASTVEVACTHTEFLDSPAMRRHLSRSDFKLSELKTAPRGISIFISLPQTLMATHARWLRMMTALTMGEMQRTHTQPACGHPVLMVLNEFVGLRRMQAIEDGIAQIAGYGVKMVFVAQTLAQIKNVYKDNWETFIANCGVKLFFCNDDNFTREYVSKLIGDHEVARNTLNLSQTKGESMSSSSSSTSGVSFSSSTNYSSSSSGGPSGFSSGSGFTQSRGVTYSDSSTFSESRSRSASRTQGTTETTHKRPLLNPDEVGRMFGDRHHPMSMALISGLQPLALHRRPYFENRSLWGFFDPHTAYEYPPTLLEWEEIYADEKREQEHEAMRCAQAERVKKQKLIERQNREEIEKFNRQITAQYAADCRAMSVLKRKLLFACTASAMTLPLVFWHGATFLMSGGLIGFSLWLATHYRRGRAYMRSTYRLTQASR